MSKKKGNDSFALAEWAEGMSRHYLALSQEPDRKKQNARSLHFRSKQMARIATKLRDLTNAR